jgi:hypothetical protein
MLKTAKKCQKRQKQGFTGQNQKRAIFDKSVMLKRPYIEIIKPSGAQKSRPP